MVQFTYILHVHVHQLRSRPRFTCETELAVGERSGSSGIQVVARRTRFWGEGAVRTVVTLWTDGAGDVVDGVWYDGTTDTVVAGCTVARHDA